MANLYILVLQQKSQSQLLLFHLETRINDHFIVFISRQYYITLRQTGGHSILWVQGPFEPVSVPHLPAWHERTINCVHSWSCWEDDRLISCCPLKTVQSHQLCSLPSTNPLYGCTPWRQKKRAETDSSSPELSPENDLANYIPAGWHAWKAVMDSLLAQVHVKNKVQVNWVRSSLLQHNCGNMETFNREGKPPDRKRDKTITNSCGHVSLFFTPSCVYCRYLVILAVLCLI